MILQFFPGAVCVELSQAIDRLATPRAGRRNVRKLRRIDIARRFCNTKWHTPQDRAPIETSVTVFACNDVNVFGHRYSRVNQMSTIGTVRLACSTNNTSENLCGAFGRFERHIQRLA